MKTNIFQPYFIDTVAAKKHLVNTDQIIRAFSEDAAKFMKIDQKTISKALTEKNKNYAFGHTGGIAILDAVLPQLRMPYTAVITTKAAVDFDAPDRIGTDILYCVLSPKTDGPLHLQRLAAASRFFKDENLCAAIRKANTDSELQNAIQNPDGWVLAA